MRLMDGEIDLVARFVVATSRAKEEEEEQQRISDDQFPSAKGDAMPQ